jgi:protein tyrosine kinase
MAKPDEVIYDGRWAQVSRLTDEDGRPFIRKTGKYLLAGEGLAAVDFLAELSARPHPNLLVPDRFSGAPGEALVEDYPDLSHQQRLDRYGFELRNGLAQGEPSLASIVDFVAQLADGLAFVHRNGFVHQDVRARNVFVREEDGRLVPTLFDYTFVVRPFFLVEGREIADLETPPEIRVGYVLLDARYDVFQLGWLLRSLTHYEAGPDLWRPVASLGDRVEQVIARATSRFWDRYPTAAELLEDLTS